MNNLLRFISVIVFIYAPLSGAQPDVGDKQPVLLYEGPVARELKELTYPNFAVSRGQEGWVELNFMVDPEGKAYEISVGDNVGDDAFIEMAIAHLEDTEFRPARMGDEIVSGSSRMLYAFFLKSGSDGARRSFVTRYRRFSQDLNEGSQADALSELQQLEREDVRNLYEYAYLSFARYHYAARYGSLFEQMQHLKRALVEKRGDSQNDTYLGEQTLRARRQLFQLQVRNAYYAEALDTLEWMESAGDEEGVDRLRPVAEQLETLRNNDQSFEVAGTIKTNGYWGIKLLKNEFQLDDVSGDIRELKLRCQGSFVFFEFEPETKYNISSRAGRCSLELTGDPDTTFTLVQL